VNRVGCSCVVDAEFSFIMLPEARRQVTGYSPAAWPNLPRPLPSPRGSAILTETQSQGPLARKDRMDPYAACPCGSGKKFKWCCQPIYADISRAYQQDEQGQHDTALRIMDDITAAHPDNPEAWGRKAELLFQNEKFDDAEAALQKALDLNPSYPYGLYLRGQFRLREGEVPGALILLRKAADLYDASARDILGHLYMVIFDCEMKLNHPVAARAAAELSLRADASNAELVKGIDTVFGPSNPNLPAAAKKKHTYHALPAHAPADRRAAWDKALASAGTGKLSDAAAGFAKLTEEDSNDAAAWFNLGLTQAWLGQNRAAVESLDNYVALDADEKQAANAWTLAEVLRCGQGMEDDADYVEHAATVGLRDPQKYVDWLGELQKQGLLTGAQVNQEEGMLMAVILDPPPPALTPELTAKQMPRIGAMAMLVGGMVRMWHINKDAWQRTVDALKAAIGPALAGEPYVTRGPAKFHEILNDALPLMRGNATEEERKSFAQEHFAKHFEEIWLQRPLKSLGNVPPIDAAGHPVLRKKLLGAIQFLQEIAAGGKLDYDFERLRRKLNLTAGAAPAEATTAGPDIAAMAAPELAALKLDELADPQLEEVFQTAQKLDARDLAGKFAQALVNRPSRADKPDRFPWHNHLIQLAITQNDWDAALKYLNDGEKDDCEHNEGRRRNDYELRRGQVHAKQGVFDQAQEVFDRLIARVPSELKVRVSAAEAMLSAKQAGQALKYAEAGLAEARKQNSRDFEGHFLELADAARRQSK
jgi:tetratricopeptide (TPR) repeat protein